jgi:AhpD family alkylhydroperoxidase
VLIDSTLPAATQLLCAIRASQIKGCAGCLGMHTKDAAHAGETSVRLNLIAAWREAKVFTDAERSPVPPNLTRRNRALVWANEPFGGWSRTARRRCGTPPGARRDTETSQCAATPGRGCSGGRGRTRDWFADRSSWFERPGHQGHVIANLL